MLANYEPLETGRAQQFAFSGGCTNIHFGRGPAEFASSSALALIFLMQQASKQTPEKKVRWNSRQSLALHWALRRLLKWDTSFLCGLQWKSEGGWENPRLAESKKKKKDIKFLLLMHTVLLKIQCEYFSLFA